MRAVERGARVRYRSAATEKLHNLELKFYLERSLSVDEFCEVEGISRSNYYGMKKRGEGPDETHAGARRLITPEARKRWHRRRTVPASKAARTNKTVPARDRARLHAPLEAVAHFDDLARDLLI